jgi:hypothetical protein
MTPFQQQELAKQLSKEGYSPEQINKYFEYKTQASTPALQPKGESFLKSAIKDPIKTLIVKPGVRTAQAGIALLGGAKGRQFAEQDQKVNLPLLGEFNIEAQRGGLSGVKQIAGDAAKTASYLYTPGGIGAVGRTVGAGSKTLQGLKVGGITGGLFSGGESAIQNNSLKTIAKDTLTGGATGALIGGAIPAAMGGIKSLGKVNLSSLPKIEKPSIFQSNLVKKRLSELDKLDNYSSVRNATTKATERGFNVKKIIAETDLLHNAVDETGTIRTTKPDGAYDQVKNFLKPQESVVTDILKKEGKTVPLGMVETKLKKAVNDSGLKGGAKLRALKNVEDDIAGYRLDADKDGYISLATIQEAKIDKTSNINYLNPESKRADKAIAKGLRELIEESTDLVDVKNINNELSQYYSVLDYLERIDGKKVEGGKLGRYFAQTIGGIVGSHFGPVGTVVGAELAGKIKGIQMSSKFGKKIGSDLKISPAMQQAINKSKSSVISLPPAN